MIARDSDRMMTGPMCSCQSSGARLRVAGQEGGAPDSHHALGCVTALGCALLVLFSSPFLPRAPWAPASGVRCYSGGSANCSPCLGGSPSLRLVSLVLGPSCADLRLLYLVRFRELLACVWLLLCCLSVHYRFAFLALLVYVCAWPAASPRPRSWLPGSWYFTTRVHFHASLQFRSLSWRPVNWLYFRSIFDSSRTRSLITFIFFQYFFSLSLSLSSVLHFLSRSLASLLTGLLLATSACSQLDSRWLPPLRLTLTGGACLQRTPLSFP